MPTMTVQSAAMRRLRRELQSSQRRAATHAPTGGIVKKKPWPPPPPLSPPRFSGPTSPPAPAGRSDGFGGDTRLDTARPRSSASRSRGGTAPAVFEKDSSSIIAEGAQVHVRTPVGTLRTGQRLVLWLSAVVVSAADEEEEGYLRVFYNNADFPRDDPFGTVRVARCDVKNLPLPAAAAAAGINASMGSSSVTTDGSASAHVSQDKAGQRPTIAGKKLPMLKKLEKEMQSSSKAIMACW